MALFGCLLVAVMLQTATASPSISAEAAPPAASRIGVDNALRQPASSSARYHHDASGQMSGERAGALAAAWHRSAAAVPPAPEPPFFVPGHDTGATIATSFKLRNLINPGGVNGFEMLLHPGDVQGDFYRGRDCAGDTPYGSWQPANHVKFTYDPALGRISAEVSASTPYCYEYGSGNLGRLDYLQMDVVNRAIGTTVAFDNVTVNGVPKGGFSGSGWSTWMLTGVDLSGGFVIEGDLVLSWPTPPATSGQETNKLVLSVGSVAPPSPTPVPTATPTPVPTDTPTAAPTDTPTATPTDTPTPVPTATPTAAPTDAPTAAPSPSPTATLTAGASPTPAAAGCQKADLNADHVVDVGDVALLGQHWGEQGLPGWIPEDLNEDGVIDIGDVAFIGAVWLMTC
jgi:hypothetical protein